LEDGSMMGWTMDMSMCILQFKGSLQNQPLPKIGCTSTACPVLRRPVLYSDGLSCTPTACLVLRRPFLYSFSSLAFLGTSQHRLLND
jgi:hypothetical protein